MKCAAILAVPIIPITSFPPLIAKIIEPNITNYTQAFKDNTYKELEEFKFLSKLLNTLEQKQNAKIYQVALSSTTSPIAKNRAAAPHDRYADNQGHA